MRVPKTHEKIYKKNKTNNSASKNNLTNFIHIRSSGIIRKFHIPAIVRELG